jgi:hypothetical protein
MCCVDAAHKNQNGVVSHLVSIELPKPEASWSHRATEVGARGSVVVVVISEKETAMVSGIDCYRFHPIDSLCRQMKGIVA